MPEADVDHARAIGEKLRAVRQSKGMSLRDLAGKVEVSASMISQIETGKAYPSVRSIYNIAAALEVPVDYFFPDQRSSPASPSASDAQSGADMTAGETHERMFGSSSQAEATGQAAGANRAVPVMHAHARPTIELQGGVTWARLTSGAEPGAEFLEVVYAPGANSDADMTHHTGREFGLILEGELVVELGPDEHTLQQGDSIVFDSTTPHRLSNKTGLPTRALWVVWDTA